MPQPELKICNGKDETQLDIALSGHKYHCPNCDIHLTSLGFCSNCGVRFDIPEKEPENKHDRKIQHFTKFLMPHCKRCGL